MIAHLFALIEHMRLTRWTASRSLHHPAPCLAVAPAAVGQGWLDSEDRRARVFPRTFKMASAKGSASRVLFGRLVEEMEAYQRMALGVKTDLGSAISRAGASGHAHRYSEFGVRLAGVAQVIKVEV